MTETKWKQLEGRLRGWAASVLSRLSDADRRQAWLATKALLRRPTGRPHTSPRLSAESALEAVLQRLAASWDGDPQAALAFDRLVREGYQADRDEHLGAVAAGLDQPSWREVVALAALAHRQSRLSPREAVTQALRVAFDRAHHPDPAIRAESGRTLGAVGRQLDDSPDLRRAVDGFVGDHLGDLDGLLRAC